MRARKIAETKQEIIKLLEAGFEWIGKDNDGLTSGKESVEFKWLEAKLTGSDTVVYRLRMEPS